MLLLTALGKEAAPQFSRIPPAWALPNTVTPVHVSLLREPCLGCFSSNVPLTFLVKLTLSLSLISMQFHVTQMFYYLLCKEGGFSPPPYQAHRPTSSLAPSTGAEETALGNYLRKCCFFWEWSCPLGRQALFYSLSHNLSCFSGMRGRSV